jgi:hypothetical protein
VRLSAVAKLASLDVLESFVQLNVRAPRIGDERQSDVQCRYGAKGHRQLDALRLEVLAELFQVPDLESDVIERAGARALDRSGRL